MAVAHLFPPFTCFFVSRRATVSPLIAQDLSKAASVDVDDMLRFFIAQIVLDKTKPIEDIMPETKEYLEKIREVVKPIVLYGYYALYMDVVYPLLQNIVSLAARHGALTLSSGGSTMSGFMGFSTQYTTIWGRVLAPSGGRTLCMSYNFF